MTSFLLMLATAAVGLITGLIRSARRRNTDTQVRAVSTEGVVTYPREGAAIGSVFGTVLIQDPLVVASWGERVVLDETYDLGELEINLLLALCGGEIDAIVAVDAAHDDGGIARVLGGMDGVTSTTAWRFDRVNEGPALDFYTLNASWLEQSAVGQVGKVGGSSSVSAPVREVGGMFRGFRGRGTNLVGLLGGLTAPDGTLDTGSWDPSEQGLLKNVALLRLSGHWGMDEGGRKWFPFTHGLGSTTVTNFGVWVERTRIRVGNSAPWLPQWAAIPGKASWQETTNTTKDMTWLDINPIHAIRSIIIDPLNGLGLPESLLFDTRWQQAAIQVASELIGVSFRINGSVSASKVIQDLLDVVNGVMIETPSGLLYPKLIRPIGEPGNLPILNGSNTRALTWQEKSPEVTSVRLSYWSPLQREETSIVAHNDAERARRGETIIQEVTAFGVSDERTAQTLANRELNVLTRPLAAVEAQVLVGTAAGWVPGDAVIVDWEYHPATVFRVGSVDLGTQSTEYARVQLVEDVFERRGVYIEHQPPEFVPSPTTPLDVDLEIEEAPYWMWAAEYTGSFALPDLISPTPSSPTGTAAWLARAVVFGTRPNSYHNGFRVASQRRSEEFVPSVPVGLVSTGTTRPFAQEMLVKAAVTRSMQDTSGVTTLLLDAGNHELNVGHVLRVPVTYPALTFGDLASREKFGFAAHQLSHEYVLVVEVLEQGEDARVRVVRGLFDTSVAPTVATGIAHIVGTIDATEYTGDAPNWFEAEPSTWALWGGMTSQRSIPFNSDSPTTVEESQRREDVRGLGVNGNNVLDWNAATPNVVSILTSAGGTGTGYIPRASRPACSGAAWIEEVGSDILIWAERRSRLSPAPFTSGLKGIHLSASEPALEAGRILELHVFADGVWVDTVDYGVSTPGAFSITSSDLVNWGSPAILGLAVLGVQRDANAVKGIGSWQYQYLEYYSTPLPQNETGFTWMSLAFEAHDTSTSDEAAGATVDAVFTADDTYSATVMDSSALAKVGIISRVTQPTLETTTHVAGAFKAEVEVKTAGMPELWTLPQSKTFTKWADELTSSTFTATPDGPTDAQNGDFCVMTLHTISSYADPSPSTPSGWTLLDKQSQSAGGLNSFFHVYIRQVAPGFSAATTFTLPGVKHISANVTWSIVRGATQFDYAVSQQSPSNPNPPAVSSIDAWMPRCMLTIVSHGGNGVIRPNWPTPPSGYSLDGTNPSLVPGIGYIRTSQAHSYAGNDPGIWAANNAGATPNACTITIGFISIQ